MPELDAPIAVNLSITGFRVGGNKADVDLGAGTWTFQVYPQGPFGDKEFSDLGIDLPTATEVTPQDLVAQGIPLANQVTLRAALSEAIKTKIAGALTP